MGKRQNQSFLVNYIKLDKACSDMLEIKSGGVSEYINKIGASSIPERKELMSRLVKYRGIRNKLAHEVGALDKMSEINGEDIKWVKSFEKSVSSGRDPYSLYQKKLRKSTKGYKAKRALVIFLVLVVIAAAAAVAFMLLK